MSGRRVHKGAVTALAGAKLSVTAVWGRDRIVKLVATDALRRPVEVDMTVRQAREALRHLAEALDALDASPPSRFDDSPAA